MDETGIQTTSNEPPKILTRTGKKQVGVISSTERGKLTTIVCCCNAAGSFIPPFLIYGRKRMVSRLLDGAPPGTNATCTDNGWINGPKFLEWLRHFVDITRPNPEKKVILVMDNHEYHIFLEALEYATQHNVIFVSLPPHTTHRMQPLDRCVYGPFKTYFEQAVSVFQRSHVGRIISQYEVARLFGEAYLKTASAHNAIKEFESTGIWPTNRHVFNDSDFLPSSLTDRALVVKNTHDDASQFQSANIGRLSNESDRIVSPPVLENVDHNPIQVPAIATQCTTRKTIIAMPMETPTLNLDEEKENNFIPTQVSSSDISVEKNIDPKPIEMSLATNSLAVSCSTKNCNDLALTEVAPNFKKEIPTDKVRASCSTPVSANSLRSVADPLTPTPITHVKPIDIRPTPKLSPNNINRKRKIQRAEVLTSSPIKEQQKEKEEKKKRGTKAAVTKNLKDLPSTSKIGKSKKKITSKKNLQNSIFVLFVLVTRYSLWGPI
ncbi:PREDICTED: uncharacterized protein LOC105555822 [Vollenhovia emeryi]|uniref:uncharacterized protein LOC105555822 n=1 Tax=Vollenhovia emeryi TaxID=411798 RepID=UPI0005F499B3|nr:PREDICTED: uncharacterized protein LOC105555822 [Vollenhovia emeryi]